MFLCLSVIAEQMNNLSVVEINSHLIYTENPNYLLIYFMVGT